MNPYTQRRYPHNHSNTSSTANLIPPAQLPTSIRPQFTRRSSSSKRSPSSISLVGFIAWIDCSYPHSVQTGGPQDISGVSFTERVRYATLASRHLYYSPLYSSLCHQTRRLGDPTSLRITLNQMTTCTTLTQSGTANMIPAGTCSRIVASQTWAA